MGSQVSYLKHEINSLKDTTIKYQTKIGSTKQKLEQQKTHIAFLESEIEKLKLENEHLKQIQINENPQIKNGIHIISEKAIEQFVESQLLNEETNNSWIPDLIEMPMKKMPIAQIMQFLNATIKSFHMKLYNHIITVNIFPDPNK